MAVEHDARSRAILARHKMLASVPGSGWHKDDPDERNRREQGHSPLPERPIAIQQDSKIYLVGENANVFRNGLQKFSDNYDGIHPDQTAQGIEATAKYRQVLNDFPEGDICIESNIWNACNFCLGEIGVRFVMASLAPPREEG